MEVVFGSFFFNRKKWSELVLSLKDIKKVDQKGKRK